jgi:soluble P-type ATPase
MPEALRADIPGWKVLELKHLVLDLNGTLALDGTLLPGVKQAVESLSKRLTCHLITADTFGTAGALFGDAVALQLIQKGKEGEQKLALVKSLGAGSVAALGNGANDALMLGAAALGICVLGGEGAAAAAMGAADVVVTGAVAGLGLLLHPDRLRATLRR